MNEQRRQILEMLAEGKITADEAERLIGALERELPDAAPGASPSPKPRPKYLRVQMDDTSSVDGPTRINIRIPLQLLRAGVRITALIPPKALTRINAELDKAGVPIDLAELKPQHLEDLIEHLDDVTFDLDDPATRMHIFCE